jgi:hypothetical protein
MSEYLAASEILSKHLSGIDEDILNYLVDVVDGLTIQEKRTTTALHEIISPFLLDSGFCKDDDSAISVCKEISIAYGSSGYKPISSNNLSEKVQEDEAPILLAAPLKIANQQEYLKSKHSYRDATNFEFQPVNPNEIVNEDREAESKVKINNNIALDAKSIPTTQKELRKQRKLTEQLQKILRAEASARSQAEAEMAAARMAAIKASRTQGRQANSGVKIDRFSIPHPSGTSDLLTDVSLLLVPGHRYGLIGKNGAG